MELTVKDLIKILLKLDSAKKLYAEGGFGRSDIHVIYNVKELSNGRIILCLDGHLGEDDREGTGFDYGIDYKYMFNEGK